MKEKFYKLPAVLRKQVYLRFGFGLISLILFIAMSLQYRNIKFCIPCLIASAFLLISGYGMLCRFLNGQYLSVEGVCSDVERTRARKRIAELRFKIENQYVRIPIHRGIQNIKKGDSVIIYMPEDASVYEQSGELIMYSYYAVEVQKEPVENKYRKRKIVNNFKK